MKNRILVLFIALLSSTIIFAQEKQDNDPTVYITASGKKYHAEGCSYLKGGGIAKKLSEVKDSYSACSRCGGVSSNIKSQARSKVSDVKQSLSNTETKDETPAPKTNEQSSGTTTKSGQTIYTGPRGGHYHYSKSGKKVYEHK